MCRLFIILRTGGGDDMPLKNKGGRMLKVALKESTLGVVDREMPEKNNNIYSPSKQKDESLASLLSDEDLYSDYDDEGNKITNYRGSKTNETSYFGTILGILLVLFIIIGLVTFFIYFI